MQNLRVRKLSFIIHPVPCVHNKEFQWRVLKGFTSYNKLSSILTVSLLPSCKVCDNGCSFLLINGYCCHLWISGCYKVATGPSSKSAFGSGLFYWLRYQNVIIWSQEMLSKDWNVGVHSARTMEGIKGCNTYDEPIERVKKM